MYISRSNFGVSIHKVRLLAMLDSKRCKERQPFTVMGSGRSTPSTAVWSILGDVRCEEDARRFRGEDDSETQKRNYLAKLIGIRNAVKRQKNLYAIDRICGSPSLWVLLAELAARCGLPGRNTPH